MHLLGLPLIDTLFICAAIPVLLVLRAMRPTVPASAPSSTAELRAAQAIVDAHGHDSLAPFILRPDKSFQFGDREVVAYRRIAETLVVSGDPIGPDGSQRDAIDRLLELAGAQRAAPVVYGASARHLDDYRRAGLRAICVGEEAVVDPGTFTLEGRRVRKLRQSVQRVRSRGWAICAVDGSDVAGALSDEIEAVERQWRHEHDHMLGFTMSLGEHEHGARGSDLLLLARSPEGELRAVMRFLGHHGNLSLDTMRRVGDTPNGLNEALVCHALAVARERGVVQVSLNYAGLAHLIRHPAAGNRVTRALRAQAIALLGRRFQMERLVRFNDKFSPEWQPRYLVYRSRAALPRSIYRVLQAEGYLPEPRAQHGHAGRPRSGPDLHEPRPVGH